MPPRREAVALAALLAMQTAILIWIDFQTAPTWDEWAHLPSGVYHLLYSDFQPYRVNPPLVRMVAATPVLAAGGSIPSFPLPDGDIGGVRSEFFLEHFYIHAHGARVFQLMSLARLSLIPISLLGTCLLWLIGRRLYGRPSGWVAAWLWCFSPTALAFGGTIVPDVSAAVFGLLAAWRFSIWLANRDWASCMWLGAATAIAMLCKSTWIILPPVFALLWLVDRSRRRSESGGVSPRAVTSLLTTPHRGDGDENVIETALCQEAPHRGKWGSDLLQAGAAVVLAWSLTHACYDFRGVLKPLGSFDFRSKALTVRENPQEPAMNRFADSWIGALPALLPADYVYGIDTQRRDFEGKYRSYYFGVWRDHGWWSYYVVALILKEPVAIWGLAAILIVGAFRGRQRRVQWREVVLFTPGVAVLLLVTSQTGFNHHLRYILPFFPVIYLVASRSVAGGGKCNRRLAAAFCLWYAASSAAMLPRSYAFFTEAIGGAKNGWRYLGDSNIDWGQDLLAVRDWAKFHRDNKPLWIIYTMPNVDFKRLDVDAEDGAGQLLNGCPNKSGWWGIFAFQMIQPEMKWFLERPATIQLTPAVKLIYISPTELKALRGIEMREVPK
jgi:hypothetical protein